MADYTGVYVYIHIPEGENPADYTVVTQPNNSLYDPIPSQNVALNKLGSAQRSIGDRTATFYRIDAIHAASVELMDSVVVTLKKNGVTVHEETFTVAEIIEERLASGTLEPKREKLNRALLQYGRYAQIRFEHNTDNLPPVDPEAPALTVIPDAYAASGDPTNFSSYIAKFEAKIEMAESVCMNIYLTPASGYSINDFVITVTDAAGNVYTDVSKPVQAGTKYAFRIMGILSPDMDLDFHITVALKSDPTKTATWTRSLITCAYENYKAATTDARRNLMMALYQYFLAAKDRFN